MIGQSFWILGFIGWCFAAVAWGLLSLLRLLARLLGQVHDLLEAVRSTEDRLSRTNASLLVAHESIRGLQNLVLGAQASDRELEDLRTEVLALTRTSRRELEDLRTEVRAVVRTQEQAVRQANPSLPSNGGR